MRRDEDNTEGEGEEGESSQPPVVAANASGLRCNGRTELCERPYGNVTFLGAHDSFAASGNPFALARTQEIDVAAQLKLGVRMLQAQGRMNNNKLHFCHTSCGLFDGGSVEDYLKKVKTFLDQNSNEVLTLIFTNPENISVAEVWKPAFDNSGISDLAYVPNEPIPKRDDWPTLGDMIETKKRVVVFLDKGAAAPEGGALVDFILPQFQMIWEDKYSSTDDKFPCKVDRTEKPLAPVDQLNMINHNLNLNIFPIGPVLIPHRLVAPKTNSVNTIFSHAYGCSNFTEERAPNFVMLDFVNVGQGMEAVNRLNGFTS
ncbi:PLC-like phosphodiesterase [Crucibulum laeve]|uniref:PLC-like phosphodiesterase n=1 Tax=Crucibulum laeve TaxID=68775 RepID=A0A5C3LSB8_9AGAR|nr:PLC-like phosphodiesterase [Crucibulum laeve]